MDSPSSTSISELARLFRPTPAFLLAAGAALVLGAALSLAGRLPPRAPNDDARPFLTSRESFRYNAENGRARSEIILLGTSRMRYGVIEEQLAREVGLPGLRVLNLGVDASALLDILRLVQLLEPSRAPGVKVAVLEISVDRFRSTRRIARVYRLGTRPSLYDHLRACWPPVQDIVSWLGEIFYLHIARALPGLVPVPRPAPPYFWSLGPDEIKRATAKFQPDALTFPTLNPTLSDDAVYVFRRIVAELKARSFRVVLLQTPRHSRYWERVNVPEDLEAFYQGLMREPASSGADAALMVRDASELGGDKVLADYNHLMRDGAEALTHKLALFLRGSGLLTDHGQE